MSEPERTPLLTDSNATTPANAPITRFEAPLDRGKIQRALAWNAGLIVFSAVAAVIAAAGCVVLVITGFGSWFTPTIVGAVALAALVVIAQSLVRRRTIDRMVNGASVAIRVDADGITLASSPHIPWSEIVFVGLLNRHATQRKLERNVVMGVGARTVKNAGEGSYLCEIGVRDGAAIQAAFGGRPGAKSVTLYDDFGGRKRGLVPVGLDIIADGEQVQLAVQAIRSAAATRNVPNAVHTAVLEYFSWKMPMLEPNWSR